MRYLWPLGAFLAVLAISLVLACNGSDNDQGTIVITFPTPTADSESTPTPTATPTPTPSPTPTPTPGPEVCGVNPDPAPASVLQVQEPKPGERVGNPFHVRGWGSEIGYEASGVAVALVDAKGDPFPPLEVPPQPRTGRVPPGGLKVTDFTAPFGVDMFLPELDTPTPFCIWVFLETTSEGIPKQVLQVPVVIAAYR